MLLDQLVPALGLIAAVVLTYAWTRYLPATDEDRARWKAQKQARLEEQEKTRAIQRAARDAVAKESAK